MRVLVTGGAGFVGAWTVRALLDDSHDVCLQVRDPSKLASVLGPLGASGVDHVRGDAWMMMVPDLPTNRVVAAGPLITVREVTSRLQ